MIAVYDADARAFSSVVDVGQLIVCDGKFNGAKLLMIKAARLLALHLVKL